MQARIAATSTRVRDATLPSGRARASVPVVHKGRNHRSVEAARAGNVQGSRAFFLPFTSKGRPALLDWIGSLLARARVALWPCRPQVHGTWPNCPRQSTTLLLANTYLMTLQN